MKINAKLLEILVCPVTKGKLIYDKKRKEFISKSARLAYPIKDKIPILSEEDARVLTQQEIKNFER